MFRWRANFHEVRGEAHAAAGDSALALADCGVASRLAHESGISELIAQIENNFALVASDFGEMRSAIERHEIALAEARRTSMTWRVAYSALNYASTLTTAGRARAARATSSARRSRAASRPQRSKPKPRPSAFRWRSCSTTGAARSLRGRRRACVRDFDRREAQRIALGHRRHSPNFDPRRARPPKRARCSARALDAMPRAHRCTGVLFAPCGASKRRDARTRAAAERCSARSSGRPRDAPRPSPAAPLAHATLAGARLRIGSAVRSTRRLRWKPRAGGSDALDLVSRHRRRPRHRALAHRGAGGEGPADRRASSKWRGWSPTARPTSRSRSACTSATHRRTPSHRRFLRASACARVRSSRRRIGDPAHGGNPGYPQGRDSV